MHDRFVRGYLAGTIGGVVMALVNYILYKLGFSETKLQDLVSIIFFGYISQDVLRQALAQIIQTGHAAVTGVAFAYLIPWINSDHLKLKGATCGVSVWFLIFAVGSLYKLPLFINISVPTVFTYLLSSTVWGISAALVLIWFEQHYMSAQKSHQIIASPVYKRYSEDNNELLDERLDHQEQLLKQIIDKQPKTKRSFLSRFRFW